MSAYDRYLFEGPRWWVLEYGLALWAELEAITTSGPKAAPYDVLTLHLYDGDLRFETGARSVRAVRVGDDPPDVFTEPQHPTAWLTDDS